MAKNILSHHLQRLIYLAATLTSSCHTISAAPEPQAAQLVKADDASLYRIKSAIENDMKRKNIVFGATDWNRSSVISVLPVKSISPNGAPFNQQDFAVPILFELMMAGPECYLIRKDTQKKIILNDINCQPLTAV